MMQLRTLPHMYETRNRGIKCRKGQCKVQVGPNQFETFDGDELVAFSDSSHADTPPLCTCRECYQMHQINWEQNEALKSTMAHVMTCAGAPVSWRSATGGRNDSTTRSELEAATEAATEAARRIPTMKGVLNDMGRKQGRTKLFVDNAAVAFMCQKKFSTKKCWQQCVM